MHPGARVGPYLVLSRLGAGGMGEVWRARDERLGRDVAIKVLPAGFAADAERLARFEREARATAALSHPNILAIFDVGIHDEQPYLVEELLEGESLRIRLLDGPLPVREALALGVQVARGLAAAHDKRIVHRDLKSDNVIVTPDGTAKILDFGLAKIVEPVSGDAETVTGVAASATEAGRVLGSAAYMAPEQARGLAVDHRADIFAFGVLLHELLSGQRPFRGQTLSDTVAAILKDEPEPLPEVIPVPVRALVRRCLEKRPEDRFTSARDIAFALQAQLEGAPRTVAKPPEEERPYPGLAAFSEGDARRFFGRDEEIASLWRKTPSRSLLALIGPSGVGKTSFIRAGLVPHVPPGWRCIVVTPGQEPFASLARALAPAFTGDAEAVPLLVDFHDPDTAVRLVERWRQRSDHGLIVVDQFEELFTLNPEDVQSRFTELLGSLAALDGVHVLLSMRDDFFFACHRLAALKDVFLDVTPLGPPSVGGLRHALIEPAKAMGFAFEDPSLVDEMVHAVEGERGALPLLAFAAASLWERRDQEARRLTRSAYDAIGGVAGALAQHAEATLERLGAEKALLVREIFRNLTTSQQTRCVLDVEELLTVFPEADKTAAREALSQLVGARLLTEFEVESPDGSRHDRVELVHESLLTAWPRLVRWRTEDEGGAQLRDQLRQTAHLWEEKGRPEDLLWAGTTFREFAVWRERYPGGLSDVEEAYGRAMTVLAGRRRRRRRAAVAVLVALLTAGLLVVGSFWRRSVRETRRAEAEAALREAGQLLALGRVKVPDSPNAALAFAAASLERADNGPARRFAVEALWQGPPALFVGDPTSNGWGALAWSPDGRRLALGGPGGLTVLDRETGARRQLTSSMEFLRGFTSDGRRLVADAAAGAPTLLHVWAFPEGRLERSLGHPGGSDAFLAGDRPLTLTWRRSSPQGVVWVLVRELPVDGSPLRELGQWDPGGLAEGIQVGTDAWPLDFDPTATWLYSVKEGRLVQQPVAELAAPGRVLGTAGPGAFVRAQPWRDRVATGDSRGDVRIWDIAGGRVERTIRSHADARLIALDPEGRFLAAGPPGGAPPRSLVLFDLAAPPTAEPVPLRAEGLSTLFQMRFGPDGSWLGTVSPFFAALWSTNGPRPMVLGREKVTGASVAFSPDGRHVLSMTYEGVLRRWPLDAGSGDKSARELWSQPGAYAQATLRLDPGGRRLAVQEGPAGRVFVVPLDGSPASTHVLRRDQGVALWIEDPVWDPSGRYLAVGGVRSAARPDAHPVRILDLATGEERGLDTHPKAGSGCEEPEGQRAGWAQPIWLADGRLVTDGDAGLRVWDLETGSSELLRPCRSNPWLLVLLATPDSRAILRLDWADPTSMPSVLSVFDLASRTTREIVSHGNQVSSVALDAGGTILVTGDKLGVMRVGPLGGGEPHLLYGHTGPVTSVAISPDGRRIVSASDDRTIRVWPMPDLAKPPLHTLPHGELLAKLRALTNLRAVRDTSSDTGWKVEVGPFPGWAEVPEWWP